MFEPIKITAWLQCGVVSDASLPIDALLYYQAFREANGPQEVTLPGAANGGREGHLWLKVLQGGTDRWYYAASFAQWNGTVAEGQSHWSKRFDVSLADLVDFKGKRGKVIVEQGAYKAYYMPIFYRHALSVSWYVVGDLAWVRQMLSTATHLGKKTGQGDGSVLRWRVEPFPHDWSIYGANGQLMRAIPAEQGIRVGYRPSYWLAKNQAPCRVPEGVV